VWKKRIHEKGDGFIDKAYDTFYGAFIMFLIQNRREKLQIKSLALNFLPSWHNCETQRR